MHWFGFPTRTVAMSAVPLSFFTDRVSYNDNTPKVGEWFSKGLANGTWASNLSKTQYVSNMRLNIGGLPVERGPSFAVEYRGTFWRRWRIMFTGGYGPMAIT